MLFFMTVSKSIHMSTDDSISFLLVVEQYSIAYIVYMYHISIHSSVDVHLGCFNGLVIVNNAVNYRVCQSKFFYQKDKILYKTHLKNTTHHSFS